MILEALKLEEICECCHGEGEVPNEEVIQLAKEFEEKVQWFQKDEGLPRHLAMDKTEALFERQGKILPWNEPDHFSCMECEGRGTRLTEEGLQLIRFLKKYL